VKPWDDIVGQERVLDTLKRAVAVSRIAHAYLFHGPRGVGKCAVARGFASFLLCDAPREGESCGTCPSCTAFLAGKHPDFDFLAPPEGARQISIDAVREISRRAHLTPSRSARRVFLIDEAHAMTEEAANSLLKTLEEPPPGTVILLITFKPEALLSTVVSRTQPVFFRALPPSTCARLLVERHAVPPEEAEELAGLSIGAPGLALEIRADAAYQRRDEIIEALWNVEKRTLFEHAETLLEIARESGGSKTLESLREGIRSVLRIASTLLRDVAVLARTGDEGAVLNLSNRSRARAFADRWHWGLAETSLESLARARGALERNVSPSLVVEWWLSSWLRLRELRKR